MMRSGTKKETNQIISDVADGVAVLKIINQYALDLLKLETSDDLAWYVARQVVGKLGFTDCVVCFVDAGENLVRQQAAFGNKKNPASNEIANMLNIPIGTGVTGTVAGSGQSLVVDDVEKFAGYVTDIDPARSEICVPIMVNGQVFGVIDCEDPRVGYFTETDLQFLTTVATMMGLRLQLIMQGENTELAAKLADSEERFRDITEATSDWYWETGPDLRYTYVSSRFYEATGIKQEDFIGKERTAFVSSHFIEQNPEEWQAHQEDLKHHRAFQDFEYSSGAAVKNLRYVRVSGKPFFDQSGNFLGYRGTANSIDERINAGVALKASEQRFRDFAESSSDWLWEMGPDLKFTYLSESYRQMTGLDPEQALGKARHELLVERPQSKKWKLHLEDLENHRSFRNFQYRLVQTDGIHRFVMSSGKPVFDGQGKFTGYRGTGTNVTAQVEAEILTQTMTSAIDSVPDMMSLFDADGCLVFANKKFIDTLNGIRDILVPGVYFEDITRAAVAEGLVRGLEGDPEQWIKERTRRFFTPHEPVLHQQNDGKWVLTTDHKMENGGTFIHRTDVTELIATQKQLELAKNEAESASLIKTDFLANMSHELRTPLNAIIGFSDIIRQQLYGPIGNEKYLEYLDDIYDSGQHLLELISDILNVSAIEAGKLELHNEMLDVKAIMTATSHLVQGQADEGNVLLSSDTGDNLPMLTGDKRRLMQILLNLSSNAIKFTLPGGTVHMYACLNDDNAITITVTDSGIGMDPKEIDKAMTEFGQVEFGIARNNAGAGLGLPLTKGLVELHGGSLTIDSTKGKGTTATVCFPADRTISRLI